jgi:hypothetical protein
MENEPPPVERYVRITAQREDVYEVFTERFLRPEVQYKEMYGKDYQNKTITAVVGGGIAEREPGWSQGPVRHPR